MGKAKAKRSTRRAKPPVGAAPPALPAAPAHPAGEPAEISAPSEAPEAAIVSAAPPPPAPAGVSVTFVLVHPEARQVSLCGDFNGWAPDATPMKKTDGVHWEATVALAEGRHQYKFVVDGQWIPDPQADEHVWNHHGTLNSVVEVRSAAGA